MLKSVSTTAATTRIWPKAAWLEVERIAMFLLLALFGGAAIRRGLAPLSALETPLKKLAQGELDVHVPVLTHHEIETIAEAINSAATAIRDRDQHLRKLASYDQLTGLANRRYFLERLE
ncbi:MAG: HAMP domain-containing protein [Gammaproteobacteria bacterium]|nr:HAMP domain-containing protein [Gammaproteobacteria bacterium]